ncbi:Methenyltetrahydrofolate cyclohydrolase [compost metagenome]
MTKPANLPSYRYPLEELFQEFASVQAPGTVGGAAMQAAFAASLVAKAARKTLGREGFEPMTEEMQRIITRAESLSDGLQEAIDQDAMAANRLSHAYALPQSSTEEQGVRRDCIALALSNQAKNPLALAQSAREVLALAESVLRYGHPQNTSAAFLAARSAAAATMACALFALAKSREASEIAAEIEGKATTLWHEAQSLDRELTQLSWERVSGARIV